METVELVETKRKKKYAGIAPIVVVGLAPDPKVSLATSVAKHFGVSEECLKAPFSRGANKEEFDARFFLSTYIAYVMDKGASPTAKFIGRGHADVLHARNQVEVRIAVEKRYRAMSLAVLIDIQKDLVELPVLAGRNPNKLSHYRKRHFPFAQILDKKRGTVIL